MAEPQQTGTPPVTRNVVVDLDHCLASTDTLWEALFKLLGREPLAVFLLPLWLLGGKARFKEEICRRADLDATTLPYNEKVLAYARQKKQDGCRVMLATAADRTVADRVAQHVGLFDQVLASDGQVNLSASRKLEAIRQACGGDGFEYLGDSAADLSVWAGADQAVLVEPSRSVRSRAQKICGEVTVLQREGRSTVKSLVRLLRPHQWVKNLIIFVPLGLAHELHRFDKIVTAVLAFAGFCFAASSVYIFNDLTDLESDRRHPRKRKRAIAAGQIRIPFALSTAALLVVVAALVGLWAAPSLAPLLLVYVAVTTVYSHWLKRKVFLDVLSLTGLYTYRLFAGGVVTEVVLSEWLLAFSMFLFLSLAMAKRYIELALTQTASGVVNARRGYLPGDVPLVGVLGSVSGYLAVLVLALYINGPNAVEHYAWPRLLWFSCPVFLYWISRIWFLAYRGELHDDPIVFAIKDRVTYICVAVCIAIFLAASRGIGGSFFVA